MKILWFSLILFISINSFSMYEHINELIKESQELRKNISKARVPQSVPVKKNIKEFTKYLNVIEATESP